MCYKETTTRSLRIKEKNKSSHTTPECYKNMTHVILPQILEIKTSDGTTVRYNLIAVIKHSGDGTDGGHYIAAIKSKEEEVKKDIDWMVFDDEKVSPVKEEDILMKKSGVNPFIPSIVFYRKVSEE